MSATATLLTYNITAENAEQRLDNFLLCKLKKVPKSHIYKMLRKGSIRVNKKRAKPDYRLQAGDLIRLPFLSEPAQENLAKPSTKLIRQLEKNILYEDENLLVLNKPAGIAVHGGSGINFGVIEIMRAARPKLKNLELVHRLDRDTSGCLMLAKKRGCLRELHALLRDGKIKKTYLALVKGKWQGKTRKVSAALLKNQLSSGERIVKVNQAGKEACTIFRPLKIFSNASLLEVELASGRTHQIRVHAQYINHPIAGDEKYGDKNFNVELRKLGLKRLFLHAAGLSFQLACGKKINIKAALSEGLEKVLEELPNN